MSKNEVSFNSRVELRKHIVDAASHVVADDPWYVSKIATAQDGSYYAKIAAIDASANGVYKWNGRTDEESRIRFYHWSSFPQGVTTLWESSGFSSVASKDKKAPEPC